MLLDLLGTSAGIIRSVDGCVTNILGCGKAVRGTLIARVDVAV